MKNLNHEILWTMKCLYLPGDMVIKHNHTFFHYLYIEDGSGTITINKTTLNLLPHHLYTVNPMSMHEFKAGKNGLSAYEIKFEISDKILYKKLCSLPMSINTEGYGIKAIFQSLFSEITSKDFYYSDIIEIKFRELITLLYRCSEHQLTSTTEDTPSTDKFAPVINYINQHLQEQITLQILADTVHMESIYFLKKFKQIMGITPMNYVRNIRINRAKNLLLHSDMNVTQISAAVGFLTIHHFSSVFKTMTGLSPSEYRDNNNKI